MQSLGQPAHLAKLRSFVGKLNRQKTTQTHTLSLLLLTVLLLMMISHPAWGAARGAAARFAASSSALVTIRQRLSCLEHRVWVRSHGTSPCVTKTGCRCNLSPDDWCLAGFTQADSHFPIQNTLKALCLHGRRLQQQQQQQSCHQARALSYKG